MYRLLNRIFGLFMVVAAGLFLASCQDGAIDDFSPKATRPLPQKIIDKMKAKGMNRNAPIYIRVFKDEHVVEVWKQKTSGKYDMIANYNICAWSGTLGPKFKQGDRQAPEGFYPIRPHNMNPASKYFLALNTGFPNAFDRAHGRNGSDLMIHGACSSSGCYSVTDENISEIYAFARDAFAGGQQEIMLELMPFRMTPEKMAVYREHKAFEFWNMVKEGYDYFELTKTPPQVGFCEKKYAFNRGISGGNGTEACPAPLQTAYSATYASYQSKFETAYVSAAQKYAHTPFPVVMGGKSRPLDKKWKAQPVKKEKTAQLPTPVRAPLPTTDSPAPERFDDQSAATGDAVDATSKQVQAPAAAGTQTVAETLPNNGEVPAAKSQTTGNEQAAASADAAQVPPEASQATQTAQAGTVPVPQPNPRNGDADAATDNAEPEAAVVKKKKRWWPFNGG